MKKRKTEKKEQKVKVRGREATHQGKTEGVTGTPPAQRLAGIGQRNGDPRHDRELIHWAMLAFGTQEMEVNSTKSTTSLKKRKLKKSC